MIPHNLPTLGDEEQAAAARALGSGWIAQGPEVEAFENELCRFLGLPERHAVAVSSGSAALYLALWALGAERRRIGLPVYACASLRNAVGLAGGSCVYLDCEAGGPNMDPAAAARAGVDLLLAPSLFGLPAPLPAEAPFPIIDDVAQALGASAADGPCGLRGAVGVCSFYATKLATSAGQGGAVVSRDRALVEAVRDYRAFDAREDAKLRFNFQMTDVQAAVGRVQLRRLPEFLARRARLFELYRSEGLELLDSRARGDRPVRYRAVVRCARPERVIAALAEAGVRAIVPVERGELLDVPERYPEALCLTRTTVSLPLYPRLTDEDATRIAQRVREAS